MTLTFLSQNNLMLRLTAVQPDHLDIFYQHHIDPVAIQMAAFTSPDPHNREMFDQHWQKILADDTVLKRTILVDDQVVGQIYSFVMFEQREVGYWLGREMWGKGYATQALTAFLELEKTRPLFARAVKDNVGSRRVLEKCGFVCADEGTGFAHGRGAEVEEWIFRID